MKAHDPGRLYIGLMSGTSVDGVDAALVSFGPENRCELIVTHVEKYPASLHEEIISAIVQPATLDVDKLGSLDRAIGDCFATAAKNLLEAGNIDRGTVAAIGSHGQTVRHMPRAERPFTIQLGDPNVIAAHTGITTVADFRRRDVALGGEGAPLAPAFHQWLFASDTTPTVVVNIGGIANVTVLHPDRGQTSGFDTGPGNTLLDGWIRENSGEDFDARGELARSGTVAAGLLRLMLGDDYFSAEPPKSTGREHFNLQWLQKTLAASANQELAIADVQATLLELTCQSICDAVRNHAPGATRMLVCGGGARNDFLMERLQALATGTDVLSTSACGLDPDWVEAAAFAWLARQTMRQLPGNLPGVTGASDVAVLGGVYFGRS